MFANTTRTLSRSTNLRAPLIKFRYGPARDQHQKSQPAASQSNVISATAGPGGAIYDFQVPPRWRRRPMSEEEIAYINNGGPL